MFLLRNLLMATAGVLDMALSVYTFLILGRVVISWVNADPYNPIVQFLIQVTEPALRPIRRRLPHMRGVDLSPLVLLLVIWFAQGFLVASLRDLARML